MNEMRQRGLPTRRAVNANANRGQRLVDGFLYGLVGGIAALLVARLERPETGTRDVPSLPECAIGAVSAWGVGG